MLLNKSTIKKEVCLYLKFGNSQQSLIQIASSHTPRNDEVLFLFLVFDDEVYFQLKCCLNGTRRMRATEILFLVLVCDEDVLFTTRMLY